MVEMGARDADVAVRVQTIELLNMLRSAEMLEPDDIDTVGQLIFDNEPAVRKAVAQFFVSNINDLYGSSVEDFDKEEYDAALPDVDKVEDFDEPCKLWIKFKCLAQTLSAQAKDPTGSGSKALGVSGIDHLDSRYMVATQAIFSFMPELQEWESLAGYLLHDHSSITTNGAGDVAHAVQEAYKLESGEEIILLDVLYCATKLFITQPPDTQKGSKTNKAKEEFKKRQETAAHNLSAFIPKLHSKFGSIPQAAKSILRLNQLFNPDLVDEIDDDDGEISALLDDINKQFTSHSDTEVLVEATRALRTALGRDSSKEAASRKVNDLWTNLITFHLSPLLLDSGAGGRGSLNTDKTRQLADVTGRLAQLSTVKDCCEVVEGHFKWMASKAARKRNDTFMEVLLQMLKRGEPDDDTPRESGDFEDQACKSVLKVLMFYYRWKLVSIKNAISNNDASQLDAQSLANLTKHKDEFIEALVPIVMTRKPLDSVRIAGILSALDLYVLFATLRNVKSNRSSLDEEVQDSLEVLVAEVNPLIMRAINETHEKMEKRLARKTNKKHIELPLQKAQKAKRRSRGDSANPATTNGHDRDDDDDIDRPPEDSDDEDAAGQQKGSDDEDTSDDDDNLENTADDGTSAKDLKRKTALIAETSLCELTAKIVLALLAGVVSNAKDIKARLQVNRTKLGKSYTQVVAYGDDKKEKGKAKAKGTTDPKTPVKGAAKTKTAAGKKAAPVSEPMVLSDDEIDDDEDEVRREEGDPEALREQGLEDEPTGGDDANEDDDGARVAVEDDDEMMGD